MPEIPSFFSKELSVQAGRSQSLYPSFFREAGVREDGKIKYGPTFPGATLEHARGEKTGNERDLLWPVRY